jgi:hypothetical protein
MFTEEEFWVMPDEVIDIIVMMLRDADVTNFDTLLEPGLVLWN